MQNLQLDSPNHPPNPNNGPTAPPLPFGQPQPPPPPPPPGAVSSGGPNHSEPPPPGAVSSGPPGAVPLFMLPNRPTSGGALRSRPPEPRPRGPPGTHPSTSLTAGPPVPRINGGVMSNGPRAFGGPSERQHAALFHQPTQVAPPPFSAPSKGAMQPYSRPPSYSAQGQGIPQQPGATAAAQRWEMQSRQNAPPPPIPGSVQPPRMHGMAPPSPNQQSMAAISPPTGPSGNLASSPSKIDPNQIPRPVPGSPVLLLETRQVNEANPPPIVPPSPIPGSVQPPRMYGMAPPLLNQQSMATISPPTGPSGNLASGPSKIDPNQISRPVPGSPVLLHETRQGNEANRQPVYMPMDSAETQCEQIKNVDELPSIVLDHRKEEYEKRKRMKKKKVLSDVGSPRAQQDMRADASSEFDKEVEVEILKAPQNESRHAETNPIPEPEKPAYDNNPLSLEEREYMELDDDVITSLATLKRRFKEVGRRTQILKGSLVEGLNQNRVMNETIEGMKQSVAECDVLRQRVIELEGELAREKEGRRVSDQRLALMKQILNGTNVDPATSY